MSKPIVRAITPFDATAGTTIEFNWSGRQMKANIATITDATSGTVVYQQQQSSFKGTHIIPGTNSGLTNNTGYHITIQVVDMDDNISEASEPALFYCYTTPTINLYRLYEDNSDLINNPDNVNPYVCDASNIYIRVGYVNPSTETSNLLNTWKITLYNSAKVSLDYSDDLYAANTLDYDFSGLMDLTEYYLRVEGLTTSGMPIDTGYIPFTINYSVPAKFSNLYLVNNPEEGNIHIQSYATSTTGRAKQEPVVYLYDENNKPYAVDLTDGNEIDFSEGVLLNKVFTIVITLRDLELYKTFMTLSDSVGQFLELKYWKTAVLVNGSTHNQYQVWLSGNNRDCNYSLWSNALTDEPEETDWLSIIINRDTNGIYSMRWMNLSAS